MIGFAVSVPNPVGWIRTNCLCILMDCFRDLGRDYLVSVPLSDPGCVLSLYLFRREDSDNEAAKAFFDGAEEID